MMFSDDVLLQLEEQAIQAAKQAAEKIANTNSEALTIESKSRGRSRAAQVVTRLDRECEDIIRRGLDASIKQYDLGWLAEESAPAIVGQADARFNKCAFWCVDPLDGTLSYLEQQPGYAVAIALVSKAGRPILGVVCDPITQRVHSRQQLPNRRIADGALHLYADVSFVSSKVFSSWCPRCEQFAETLGYQSLHIHTGFGAVMNACAVLENEDAFYLKLPKEQEGGGAVWDFAATAALFEAAGKPYSDSRGECLHLNPENSLYYHHTGVLFSGSERLHQDILKWINE
jgi:3'(2'), 5'-bisphosphate nucleotidase/myo-inositol-1(or 4)-monophosphatase